jgi:hypothetical protein
MFDNVSEMAPYNIALKQLLATFRNLRIATAISLLLTVSGCNYNESSLGNDNASAHTIAGPDYSAGDFRGQNLNG